jgi:hypothetical protein
MSILLALGAVLVTQDPAQSKLARSFKNPERITEAEESAGLASPKFETRYAALLVKIHRVFSAGRGFEPLHKAILGMSADTPRATAHLKAIADSLRTSLCCSPCEGKGRISCEACKGEGRRDISCKDCKGEGRIRPAGVQDSSNATMKCRNCDGMKVFKKARCPECAGLGKRKCEACKGEPWPESRCQTKECQKGRVPCEACRGAGRVKVKCPQCENGRIKPNGAAGGSTVLVKCKKCEKSDGTQGDGQLDDDCKACGKSGKVTCKTCGGMLGRAAGAGPDVSSIFTLEACGGCPGAGCAACLGLGSRVIPKADPAQTVK